MRPRNPLVTHRWIFAGIGIVVAGSIVALYFALGLLFWQGQWQLIFHPSHAMDLPNESAPAHENVRFDATETGQPRLDGWWIPATGSIPHRPAVILYLHDAHGSLADYVDDLQGLHALGNDVFAFDPRGFGKSAWAKPSEQHWNEDANAALSYLASVRHIPAQRVILVGRGLGGTVAANLTLAHFELRSVAMIDPQPPTLALLQSPRWTRILPVRLLARDRFDPETAFRSASVDKLFLVSPDAPAPNYVARSSPPSAIVHSTVVGDAQTAPALHRFFEKSYAENH